MVNRKYFFLFLPVMVFLAGGCAQRDFSSSKRCATSSVAAKLPNTPNIWPASAPPIHAHYAILIDAQSGRTLFQKNADVHTPVASTQKLITALLVTEKGHLDAFIPVQSEDTNVAPSKLNLRAGDHYSRRALLNAMLVASMNDAAAALGRDAVGSTAAVGPAMTRLARTLGACDSLFLNASGLPAPQYSTARDMARIGWRAYYDSTIRQIVRQPTYLFHYANGKTRFLKATNLLLGKSPIYNGLKTGDTKASGRCLITSATFNGRVWILVQLKSKTRYIFHDADKIMSWAISR